MRAIRTFLKKGGVWICQPGDDVDFKNFFSTALIFLVLFVSRQKERILEFKVCWPSANVRLKTKPQRAQRSIDSQRLQCEVPIWLVPISLFG
jgi:hypothetical protein